MQVAMLAAGAALALALAQLPGPAAPNEGRRTVWTGVFTDAQADRGASGFTTHCEGCHGRELAGGMGPALVGPGFMRNWTGLTLRELFHHVRVAMPEEAVSSVTDREKLDILAFIFRRNGFPSGNRELTTDPLELGGIAFEAQTGPEPPPTGSTVRTFGCLIREAAGGWLLQQATEPVRTTLEAERDQKPGDRPTPPAPGAAMIRLIGVPAGAMPIGQRVRLIGLMVREPDGSRINVLELSALGAGCTP
jgi:hypothetical protein